MTIAVWFYGFILPLAGFTIRESNIHAVMGHQAVLAAKVIVFVFTISQ